MTDYSVLAPRGGYGLERLPITVDVRIRELMQGIASNDDYVRVKSELPPDSWEMLGAFAERMASLAVREGSVHDIRAGLVAAELALAQGDDFREVLPSVSLLHRASELIGVDPAAEFRAAVELAGNAPDDYLARFLERAPEKKRIERMGFAEGADESGFRFRYTR